MNIDVVGLNHRTAPLQVRERLAFPRRRLSDALSSLRSERGIEGAVILSTCNRVEVYVTSRNARCDGVAKDFLARFHGLDVGAFGRHLYGYHGVEAVQHLFHVTSGLDSMVLGESQITAQVKSAYEAASAEGAAGAVLHRLFQHALAAAKRVRSNSDIGSGRASIASVATALAKRQFGTLAGRSVLLVGAGKMGEAALRNLRDAGTDTSLVANRTFSKAKALARHYGGTTVRFDRLAEGLAQADVVICSTEAPHYVIRRRDVSAALSRRRGRPMFLIDIAVPRNIEPSAGKLKGCHLYNVDDLQAVVQETLQRRKRELERCRAIVDEETRKFMRWVEGLEAGRAIARLSRRLEALKRRELRDVLERSPHLSQNERAEIERTADRMMKKLGHQLIKVLRESSSPARQEAILARADELFRLKERLPTGTLPPRRRKNP